MNPSLTIPPVATRRSIAFTHRGVGVLKPKEKTYRISDLRCLRLYEAGHLYILPLALAHAARKRDLVAVERPAAWVAPSLFRLPEVLTEAEVVEAEAELRAMQRHALELVDTEFSD
jgi:hypothetical protein